MGRNSREMTELPCQSCVTLAKAGDIRAETIQPLPAGALAPRGMDGQPCCYDCQAAEAVRRIRYAPSFEAARIAVGNERQEQYRLPGVPMGLVQQGFVRPSKKGDFEKHLKWLEKNNWFGTQEHADD